MTYNRDDRRIFEEEWKAVEVLQIDEPADERDERADEKEQREDEALLIEPVDKFGRCGVVLHVEKL